MTSMLLCNYRKCRKQLNSQAWVTSCSHVFCSEDGTREFEKSLVCPACETPLPGRYDAVFVDLDPSEQYKSMVLAGHKPDVVLDITTRAITFWNYQVHQEIVYQEYIYKKAKERLKQFEKYYENLLQKARNELEQAKGELNETKKEVEVLQKKSAELSEKLTEQSRNYRKLQSINDALRCKFISPAFFEKQTMNKKKSNKTNTIGPTSANDVIFSHNHGRAASDCFELERDFVLRPVSTPVMQSGRQNPFNFIQGSIHRNQK